MDDVPSDVLFVIAPTYGEAVRAVYDLPEYPGRWRYLATDDEWRLRGVGPNRRVLRVA